MSEDPYYNSNWFNIEDAALHISMGFGKDARGHENYAKLCIQGHCHQRTSGFDDFGKTFGVGSLTLFASEQTDGQLNISPRDEHVEKHSADVWFPVSQAELDLMLRYFAAGNSVKLRATVQYIDKRNLFEFVDAETSERMKIKVSHVQVGTQH